MTDFFSNFRSGLFASITIFDILDILIMAVLIYGVLRFFKNTKAMHVLIGLAVLVVALAVASWIGLPTTTWMLSSIFTSGIVIIVILFQPELRRVFENIGRGQISFSSNGSDSGIEQVILACENLSKRKVGALLVFKRKSSLNDIISTGTTMNADISAGLIINIFEPNTPLHDGASVIVGNKIVAAGCFLPLSENDTVEKTLGTRHRAALGISEHSDALTIVVSEETGIISATAKGELTRYLDSDSLRKLLSDFYAEEKPFSVSALFSKEGE